ncbi:hypothetical protein HanIR_Chr05g0217771 [Helianthus annuus]|nr:hypothetical protein HanIR_Chr05g0217771 [Helianthus annuus]
MGVVSTVIWGGGTGLVEALVVGVTTGVFGVDMAGVEVEEGVVAGVEVEGEVVAGVEMVVEGEVDE